MKLNCAIIDDEPLARECLTGYIDTVDFLHNEGTGNNPIELSQLLSNRQIDLIFLDIQMPIMSGIDFLKMTTKPPLVIITTAYPSYALEGFQLDVLDYLLKPITFDRFFKAACKARDYFSMLKKTKTLMSAAEDYFFIKCEYKYERIYFEDILYIQGLQNYVTIFTRKGKYITLLLLKNVEEYLDPQAFIRVHKSFIVPVAQIESIENNEIIIQSHHIPIGRNYREEVLEKVVNKKLWRKPGEGNP